MERQGGITYPNSYLEEVVDVDSDSITSTVEAGGGGGVYIDVPTTTSSNCIAGGFDRIEDVDNNQETLRKVSVVIPLSSRSSSVEKEKYKDDSKEISNRIRIESIESCDSLQIDKDPTEEDANTITEHDGKKELSGAGINEISSTSSISDIDEDIIEDDKNLAELLIKERITHQNNKNYDPSVLEEIDKVGIESQLLQAEANRKVREVLLARPKRPPTKAAVESVPVLKMQEDLDHSLSFKDFPVWNQFAIEASPFTRDLSTQSKRINKFVERNKKLRFFERLHEEVMGLLGWLEPTDIEFELRRRVVARVEHVARKLWPSCSVSIFGSVASGLSMPTGDIDINITGLSHKGQQNEKASLRLLASHLIEWKLVRAMEVVLGAKVPIIKCMDSVTEYPIDITINQPSSSETTRYLKRHLKMHTFLRPLILLLKVYLQQRNLAETYHGGIGSYLLFCMVLGFLQQHAMNSDPTLIAKLSLGHLLFDFFQYYGIDHPYASMGISVRDGGKTYLKKSKGFFQQDRPYLLSIESPLDPSVDVGKNSYNIGIIREAFRKTYAKLCHLYREYSVGNISCTDSLLKEVIYPHDTLFTRSMPFDSIREKILHYEASGGDDANPGFSEWLRKGTQWRGLAPYPSRLKHLTHPRPTLFVDDALRKETERHFGKYFEMIKKLRKLRKEALKHERERENGLNKNNFNSGNFGEDGALKRRRDDGTTYNRNNDEYNHSHIKRIRTDYEGNSSHPPTFYNTTSYEGRRGDNGDNTVLVERGMERSNINNSEVVVSDGTAAGQRNQQLSKPIEESSSNSLSRGIIESGIPPVSPLIMKKQLGQRFDPLITFLGVAVDKEEGDNLLLDSHNNTNNTNNMW